MDTLEVLRGLSDPTRLRMVVLLHEGELCVCDLVEVLRLPQSTLSRHMARLKSAGLVTDHRDGKWVHYRLKDDKQVKELVRLLAKNGHGDGQFVRDRESLTRYQQIKECD